MYGYNAPNGFQPIKSLNSSTWNGQTNPYFIESGYPNNIFTGDVVVHLAGYIVSLADAPGGAETAPILGVFNGCSFQVPTALNPIDPASPGRAFWPGGTVLVGQTYAVADIIDDPSTVFNIQSDGAGFAFETQSKNAKVAIDLNGGGLVNGNLITGTSLMTASWDGGTFATQANANIHVIRFVPDPQTGSVQQNVPNPGGGAIPYNNVEVIIQNHQYAARPAPLA